MPVLTEEEAKTVTLQTIRKSIPPTIRLNTTAVTELYDPTNIVTVLFKGYCDKVQTVQIDESMMDAELTSMQNMFFGGGEYDEKSNYVRYPLTNAKKIDGLEYLNTDNVTDMSGMFSGCASVESLDLASFNTDNVKDMRSMFSGCTALTTIRCKFYLDESEKLEQSEKMFEGCTSLVGENGTKCDGVNNIDKTYARPDKENAPGYFTTINEAYTVFDETTATLTYYYDDRCLNRTGNVHTPEKRDRLALRGICRQSKESRYRPIGQKRQTQKPCVYVLRRKCQNISDGTRVR